MASKKAASNADSLNILDSLPADQIERRLRVTIPGSTANLGPGFDALGLALAIYTRLTFVLLKEDDRSIARINLADGIASSLPADDSNLVYSFFSEALHHKPDLLRRARLAIDTEIPLGRGLGSSAAALLGSLYGGRAMSGSAPDNETLLSLGLRYEGHVDNISASLLGGMTICAPAGDRRKVATQRLRWPKQWRTTVVVPSYPLSTHEARLVLPKAVPRLEAVENVQRVALLVAAVVNEDESALVEALHDRLHEPYRNPLVPELESLRKYLKDSPILGCVLSGAGPSILVVHNERHHQRVNADLTGWAQRQHSQPTVLNLEVDNQGMTIANDV
ncbi:MAG TPA: homoserine kinase [Chroococcales cyanobacterium]